MSREYFNLAMRNEKMSEIVCLCGSTRFHQMFEAMNFVETMMGNIVLSIGVNARDTDLDLSESDKMMLDLLHFKKIDMAKVVVFLNCGGYMGASTTNEFIHSVRSGKDIIWVEALHNIPEKCRFRAYGENADRTIYDWEWSRKRSIERYADCGEIAAKVGLELILE